MPESITITRQVVGSNEGYEYYVEKDGKKVRVEHGFWTDVIENQTWRDLVLVLSEASQGAKEL